MSDPRPPLPRTIVVGTVLVLVGLACWALYAFQSGSERRSYAHGGNPPAYVRLVAGHTYWISISRGVQREAELGVVPSQLHCTAAAPGQASGALAVAVQNADTKATDQIASFVASTTGAAHLECDRIGPVYVDDAADASPDWSALWLILTVIALTIGIPLALSALRSSDAAEAPSPRRARPQRR